MQPAKSYAHWCALYPYALTLQIRPSGEFAVRIALYALLRTLCALRRPPKPTHSWNAPAHPAWGRDARLCVPLACGPRR